MVKTYLCLAKSAGSFIMDALTPFSIPLTSIGIKTQQFDFQVDKSFFSCFEDSIIHDGNFEVKVDVEKRPNVMEFSFHVKGSYSAECDRCLANIRQNVEGEHLLLAKFAEDGEEEAEIIYIAPLAHEVNIAKNVYEFICLSIPYSTACEGDDIEKCDETMMSYLDSGGEEEEIGDEPANNPFIDGLKDFGKK